jgi:hypothetical protein
MLVFAAKDMPYGRQFRLPDGAIAASGKIVCQGKDSPRRKR